MDSFRADPEILNTGASAILKHLEPAEGIDLEALTEHLGAFGHSGNSAAFAQFCATWQVAYLLLGSRAANAADLLNGVADNYARSDDGARQLLNPLNVGLR
jgi:hypothetical protein